MGRRTPSLGGPSGGGPRPNQGELGVELVLDLCKVEQAQLEKQMSDLLSLPNPTEVQNEFYTQLKASHTAVLARQTALHRTLLDVAEQVRQGREVRQNMPHLSALRSGDAAAAQAERSGDAAVVQAELGKQLGAGLVASRELRRRCEEEEALEWAKADSLRESSAEAKSAGETAFEAAFEQQLRLAAEESLRCAAVPPPHPGAPCTLRPPPSREPL